MNEWPSWSEMALILGGIGGAIAWLDQRLGLPKKVKTLEEKVATAETETIKATAASTTAIAEKNTELTMVREDREQWREKALYEQDRANHLETMLRACQEATS
jgi:hypothetical protein